MASLPTVLSKFLDLLPLDLQDLAILCGFAFIFYGLYLVLPWLSWVVTGGLLLLVGLFYHKIPGG